MIKIRRYGKTVIMKFINGKWIQVDSSTIVHESYRFIPFKNWFISFSFNAISSNKSIRLIPYFIIY